MTLCCAIKQDRRLKRDGGLKEGFEKRNKKIIGKKMEYLRAGGGEALEKSFKLQKVKIPKITSFK